MLDLRGVGPGRRCSDTGGLVTILKWPFFFIDRVIPNRLFEGCANFVIAFVVKKGIGLTGFPIINFFRLNFRGRYASIWGDFWGCKRISLI